MIRIKPTYPIARNVCCHGSSRISANGFPYIIPTAIWPIMPARIIFAENHSANDKKKKNEIIIKICTTVIHSQSECNFRKWRLLTTRFVVWKEASCHDNKASQRIYSVMTDMKKGS